MSRCLLGFVFLLFSLAFFKGKTYGQKLIARPFGAAPITELSDKEYPDNPDIGFRSELYGSFPHSEVRIFRESGLFDISLIPANRKGDTILIAGIDLLEWIPSIPKYLLGDEYLSLVAIVNQEFNRQQVTIPMERVTFKGRLNEQRAVTRIDIARNCLMSYLWEVILFTNSSGTDLPIYHGWFNFPKEPYQDLFLERNAMVFQKYGSYLETWKDLESRKINLELVRTVTREKELLFDDMNGRFYELEGERKKKARNIILPHSPTKITGFLNDSTTFATFSPPGIYDASDPKHTKLGSFTDPVRLMGRHVANALQPDTDLMELEIEYRLLDGSAMRLVVGGIRKVDIPSLPEEQAHKGLQNSMGFGNHSFFEGYDHAVSHSSLESPFYSFLADGEGKWLDSHIIGIDGVLLHFDANNPILLHVWVISFERHCFVGHLIADVGRFF